MTCLPRVAGLAKLWRLEASARDGYQEAPGGLNHGQPAPWAAPDSSPAKLDLRTRAE